MSNVIINVPDSGWFKAGGNVLPTDKMLCVVLHKYGDRTPNIYQFRKADWMYKKSDYFLDVSEKWTLDSVECGDKWEPGFVPMSIVDSWKPLGLPDDENKRIIDAIEAWFED